MDCSTQTRTRAPADTLEINSPQLQRLHQDWLVRCKGCNLPARSDFDVLDLKYMLGSLNLLEVLREPLRFRYRVHSSLAVDRLGFNMTGKTVDQYPNPTYAKRVHAAFAEVVATRLPKTDVGIEEINDKIVRFEALLLPLSDDGDRVHKIMVGLSIL